jgi:hypothetical protein
MAANVGLNSIYQGGLVALPYQRGAGIGKVINKIERTVGKVNRFAKDNKLGSKLSGAIDILGVREPLDLATGGTASRLTNALVKSGYGMRKKSSGSKTVMKKKCMGKSRKSKK